MVSGGRRVRVAATVVERGRVAEVGGGQVAAVDRAAVKGPADLRGMGEGERWESEDSYG